MEEIGASHAPLRQSKSGSREFAMLAHDIKGALQGVVGGISLIERVSREPEVLLQVQRVSAAAESLALLVDEALGGSDGGSDGGAGAGEGGAVGAVDVAAFLGFIARRWAGEARAKGLAFSVEPQDGLPERLLVGFQPLARILGNLIGNAVQHSDAGSVRLAVRRDARRGVVFVLADDGPGIGRADGACRSRAGGREPAGAGLGLQICKALAQRIGGTISVTARAEGGTEAVLRLPSGLCAGPREQGGPSAALPDLAGLKVLLAEDNPTNQMVASQMLRALNARVSLAMDGIEALERFEAEPFDMVILDIEMPRLSGIEVITSIRARGDARAQTPIVALTAYAMRVHRERVAAAGANGLISKPITSVERFGEAIRAHVRPVRDDRRGDAGPPGPAEAVAARAAGDAPPEPVVDAETFGALRETIGPEVMGELLDRVLADLDMARRDLEGALAPLALAPIRATSHILISVAGAIGGVRLERRARRLNMLADGGEAQAIAAELAACLEEIAAAMAFVGAEREGA